MNKNLKALLISIIIATSLIVYWLYKVVDSYDKINNTALVIKAKTISNPVINMPLYALTNVLFQITIDPKTKRHATLSANNVFALKDSDENVIWSRDITPDLYGSHPVSMRLYFGNQICIGTDFLKTRNLYAREGGFIIDLTNKTCGFLFR